MTTTQRLALKNKIIEILTGKGFKPSPRSIGKYSKVDNEGKEYRYDLTGISVRYEKKITIPAGQYWKAETKWICLWAAYYKDIKISENNTMIIPDRGSRLV